MHRIGIDVGGTFTDLIAFDDNSGTLTSIKVSTTPQDPSQSIADTLRRFLMGTAGPVGLIVHASTIGSNLFFGQMRLHLPKAALLTTEGFRDVLEIGRQRRAELYNLFYRRPAPLIRRRYRYGIRERIDATGAVQVPLDEAQLTAVAEDLRREGVEVIAVCYLHSYANPVHEERTAAVLAERLGAPALVLSSRVDPHYREYERTSTTVLNALLMPVVSRYLDRLHRTMHDLGISAPLYVMQSSGGMMTLASASALPAAVIESGPAAGVVGAAYLGRDLGLDDVLSFDMGGTTAKAGAVIGGAAQVVNEYEIAGKVHAGRIVKGSGYPVRFPFIDLAEVSAGGGTVAWVEGGGLRVGPISAGADPGPAAYGLMLTGTITWRGQMYGGTPITILAASNRLAKIPPAMRSRFAEVLHLDYYEVADLEAIGVCEAERKGIVLAEGVARYLAENGGGEPRKVGHLVRSLRNALPASQTTATMADAQTALRLSGLRPLGLSRLQARYLEVLAAAPDGTMGVNSLAGVLGTDVAEIVGAVEPYMLRIQLCQVARSGRRLTEKGRDYLRP